MMAASSPAAMTTISSTTSTPPVPWSDLLPDLLCEILTHLRAGDIARFRAVCRAWHSAARRHNHQELPWVVLPDGSFGTMTGDFFSRVPGLPDDVTCLGATAGGGCCWLAVDRTDDALRRTDYRDRYDSATLKWVEPRHDVRHAHSYMLYNPFSGETVPLPELDAIVGEVPETFEVRKVLMRMRDDDDDLVVVTTNRRNHAIIICRTGKKKGSRSVTIPHIGIWDVAFFGDDAALYGITEHEDLVVFHLAKNVDNGKPFVSGVKRVIIGHHHPPLADDGQQDPLSWMDDYQTIDDEDDDDDDETTTEYDDDVLIVGDDKVLDTDEEVPYAAKDIIVTTRRLVESSSGQELLMVRHQSQTPPFHDSYTRKVDIFKADMGAGRWVPVTATALAHQGEALFLSRSTSRVTQAYGDIKEGFLYSIDLDYAFDIRSGTHSPVSLPRQRRRAVGELLTWFFPPRLVL